jgi:hypothetical protein
MKHHVLLIDFSFLAAQERFHVGLPTGGFAERPIMSACSAQDNPPGGR